MSASSGCSMIKLLGLLLVVCTGSMLGLQKAKQFQNQAAWLAALEGFLRSMQTEIRYLAPPLEQLLSQLYAQPAYQSLTFLSGTASYLGQMPFGQAWSRAVREACSHREAKQVLLQLGGELGNSDIDGQLAAIGLAEERIHMLLESARQQSREKGKLCTVMGTLLGTLAAILLA